MKVKCHKSVPSPYSNHEMQACVRNCPETVNKHFKQWGVLIEMWRHVMYTHITVFCVITALTHLGILIRELVVDVGCKDTYLFYLQLFLETFNIKYIVSISSIITSPLNIREELV